MQQYGLDTEAGQSGSPIFAVNDEGERVVPGAHAHGGDAADHGIRITDDVFELFQSPGALTGRGGRVAN